MNGKPRLFNLRLLQEWRKLRIDLTAEVTTRDEPPTDAIKVAPRTWIQIPATVIDLDRPHLVIGLAMRAAEIETLRPEGHIVVHVLSLDYQPEYYDSDAVPLAMLGWASEEFGLQPTIQTEFDRAPNRHVIT